MECELMYRGTWWCCLRLVWYQVAASKRVVAGDSWFTFLVH